MDSIFQFGAGLVEIKMGETDYPHGRTQMIVTLRMDDEPGDMEQVVELGAGAYVAADDVALLFPDRESLTRFTSRLVAYADETGLK